MARWIRKLLGWVGLSEQRNDYEPICSHEEPPSSLLLELPLDILLLIIPYLPLVSLACLALTCKPLYILLRSVHDDEQLAWPRFLASPLPSHGLFGAELHLPRNDLLLKLEDARSLYCCGCLKLHPTNHFLSGHASIRPQSRHCKGHVGIVDLCACLALTYLNGVKLADWIHMGTPSQYLHQDICQEFEFQVINERRFLLHTCSVTSQPDAFITLKTMVTVNADNCLIVTTRYKVYWSTPHKRLGDTADCPETYRTPYHAEGVFLCPHVHALAWLYGPYAPNWKTRNGCRSCDTKFHLLDCTWDGLHTVIHSEGNLGVIQNDLDERWRELPDCGRWWKGSRRPRNGMEELWYLRPWGPREAMPERRVRANAVLT